MNVSVIVPVYNPDKKVLLNIIKAIKNQKFSGKIELKIIDRNEGYARQMNYGIRNSKYPVVIMLHQDCVPAGKYWLNNLVAPLRDQEVVAANSKVQLPVCIWNEMSKFTKALVVRERGTITPALDGKGTALRKKSIVSTGLYDEKNFKTAGEDFDMYIKLKRLGKIAYPNAKVFHYHHHTFLSRLRKNYQYANAFGALIRLNSMEVPRWYSGLLKALPFYGWVVSVATFPLSKDVSLFPYYLISSLFNHFFYICGFWKGFLSGKQTI